MKHFFVTVNLLLLLLFARVFSLDAGFPIGVYSAACSMFDEAADLNSNFAVSASTMDNSLTSTLLSTAETYGLKLFLSDGYTPSIGGYTIMSWYVSNGWEGDHDGYDVGLGFHYGASYEDKVEAEGGYSSSYYTNLMGNWYSYSWDSDVAYSRSLSTTTSGNHNGTVLVVPANTTAGTNVLYNFSSDTNRRLWFRGDSSNITVARKVYLVVRCGANTNTKIGDLKVIHVDNGTPTTVLTSSVYSPNKATGTSSTDDFASVYCGYLNLSGSFDYTNDAIDFEFKCTNISNEVEIDRISLVDAYFEDISPYFGNASDNWDLLHTWTDDEFYDQDTGAQTLYGFYVDEVTPGGINAATYFNSANNISGKRVVGLQSSISKDYVNEMYWFLRNNYLGDSDQDPLAAWSHYYPFYTEDPDSGDTGYEAKIEYFIDNAMIPHWKKLYEIADDADKPMWAGISVLTGAQNSFRKVIPSEIRLQANIALACGAKGIWYYPMYAMSFGNCVGLVDSLGNHSGAQYAYNYNAVKAYNAVLEQWSDDLLRTTWDETWKCDGTGNPIDNDLISSVTSLDGEVQFTIFDTDVSTVKYLLVVNRYTHDDASVTFTLNSSSYQRTVVDCGTNQLIDLVASGSPSVTLSNIEAGGAVLLRITTLSSSTAGSVSGEWWYDRKIGGDITVSSGNTLTLLPSVCLVFQSYTDSQSSGMDTGKSELIVEGTLQSDGNTFISTTEQANTWHSIRFNGTSSSGYIKNSVVKWAYRGIMINNCSPTIQGNDLDHNQYGIWAYGSSNDADITGNDIANCPLPLVISSSASPDVWDNKLTGTSKALYIASDAEPDYFKNNTVSGISGGYNVYLTGTYSGIQSGGTNGYGNYYVTNTSNDVVQIDGGSWFTFTYDVFQGVGTGKYYIDNNDATTTDASSCYWDDGGAPASTLFDGYVNYTEALSTEPSAGVTWKRNAQEPTVFDEGLALYQQKKYEQAAEVLFNALKLNLNDKHAPFAFSRLVRATWRVPNPSPYLTYFNMLAQANESGEITQLARAALLRYYAEAGDLSKAEKYAFKAAKKSLNSRELLLDLAYRAALNEDE